MDFHAGRKLICGVDYGTTNTRVAYCVSSYDEETIVDFLFQWVNESSGRRVPSRISYLDHDPCAPRTEQFLWGSQAERELKASSWTKLLLDDGLRKSDFFDEVLESVTQSRMLMLSGGRDAVETVSDFLLRVHESIQRMFPKFFKTQDLPVDFWFTIPASWPEEAKCRMRTAIKNAGFGNRPWHNVYLITEPEAAVFAAISQGVGNLVQNDGILVCDCGGGTVDIATYHITDIEPKLQLNKITADIGGKCGGAAVDSRFYQLLSTELKEAFDSQPLSVIGPGSNLMLYFESIKRNFQVGKSGASRIPWSGPLPTVDTKIFDRKRGQIVLTNRQICHLYDPVIANIHALIISQIKAANMKFGRPIINTVILAGGFSGSSYLQSRLREALGNFNPDISLSTIPNLLGEAAAFGAVIQGQWGPSVKNYKCTKYYGFASPPTPFCLLDPSTEFDPLLSCPTLHWLLQKDMRYPNGFEGVQKFTLYRCENESPVTRIGLYECTSENAPGHIYNAPVDVHCVQSLDCHLSALDVSYGRSRVCNGKTWHIFEIWIRATVSILDENINFGAFLAGKQIGGAKVSFSWE